MPLKDFQSICLPYCLKKQEDGSYIALNREYKPLGFNQNKHVEYSDYPIATAFKGITKTLAKKVSWEGKDDLDSIFLYDSSCTPTKSKANMEAYLNRLSLLADLKLKKKGRKRKLG